MKRDQFWTTKSLMIVILATYFALAPLVTSSASAHHETNWEGTEIDFSVPTELTPKEGVGGEFHFDYLETTPISSWRFSLSKRVRNPNTGKDESVVIFNKGASDGSPPPHVWYWDGQADDGQYLTAGGVYTFHYTIQYADQDHHSLGQSGRFRVWSNDSAASLQPVAIIPGEFSYDQGGAFNFHYAHRAGDWQAPWVLRILNSDNEIIYEDDRSEFDAQQYYSQLPQVYDWDGRSNIPGDTFGLPADPGQYTITIDMTGGFTSYSINPLSTAEFTIAPQSEDSLPSKENGDGGQGDEDGKVEGDIDEPDLDPEELAEQARLAKLNPVLLIHGFNAHPSMWTEASNNSDYVSLLKNWGYPEEYIGLYGYSGQSVTGGYNNQGGVVEVSQGMRQAIMNLRDKSLANGGSGEVNIIAHSMGGLVARQYIKEYPSDSYIDKVIAIGTPYQGSYLLDEYIAHRSTQFKLQSILLDMQIEMFSGGINPQSGGPLDMAPNSLYMSNFETFKLNGVSYYNMYGSVKSQLVLTLFNLSLKTSPSSIGDLVVTEESARWDKGPKPMQTAGFVEESVFSGTQLLVPIAGEYKYAVAFPSIRKLRYNHFDIFRQPEVKSAVLKRLHE